MEMPTMCDCGNLFNLNDGCSNHNHTITICEDCAQQNEKRKSVIEDIEQREREIEYLEEQIDSIKSLIHEDKEQLEQLPNFK